VKILTLLGTRPEIIRLSRVIDRLDSACEHVLVHTGQNFEPELSDVFFEELGVGGQITGLTFEASASGSGSARSSIARRCSCSTSGLIGCSSWATPTRV
jgi:UDP-N-acetylglucosamine 2-epimerase